MDGPALEEAAALIFAENQALKARLAAIEESVRPERIVEAIKAAVETQTQALKDRLRELETMCVELTLRNRMKDRGDRGFPWEYENFEQFKQEYPPYIPKIPPTPTQSELDELIKNSKAYKKALKDIVTP
jgi:hypothetical protein